MASRFHVVKRTNIIITRQSPHQEPVLPFPRPSTIKKYDGEKSEQDGKSAEQKTTKGLGQFFPRDVIVLLEQPAGLGLCRGWSFWGQHGLWSGRVLVEDSGGGTVKCGFRGHRAVLLISARLLH